MCIGNRYKIKRINSKYESLQQQKTIKHSAKELKEKLTSETGPIMNQKTTSSSYIKNTNPKNKLSKSYSQPGASGVSSNSQTKRAKTSKVNQNDDYIASNVSHAISSSNPNIYESLQDASVSLMNTLSSNYAATTAALGAPNQLIDLNENDNNSIISRSTVRTRPKPSTTTYETTQKAMLNLTTNTMFTVYNTSVVNNSVSVTNMGALNKKETNLDLCVRFRKEEIEIGGLVMEGTFGKILHGVLRSGDDEASATKVFIKTVGDCASRDQADLMMREACVFRNLKHKNLQSILGVCLDEEKKPMALFSLSEVGNLKKYLISVRGTSQNEIRLSNPSPIDQSVLGTHELLYLVLQILKGVNYLHSKHIVHKDIATRDCW